MRRYDYSQQVALTSEEAGVNLIIPKRYDVSEMELTSLFEDFEWQVTYKFTSGTRRNHLPKGVYGADAMTFRRLYVILCERFNGGKYFIDDYLKYQYPYRDVKKRADDYLYAVNELIAIEYDKIVSQARFTKSGSLDKRYTRTIKKLSEYKVMSSARVKEAGNLLSEWVKEDIIICLRTGILMLDKTALAETTVKRRMKLGLPADTIFFATGQLIQHVKIFFRLEKIYKW